MPKLEDGDQSLDTIFLGIDPGVSGGMACIKTFRSGSSVRIGLDPFLTNMPETENDILKWLVQFSPINGLRAFALIEKVSGFTGRRNSAGELVARGSHMFTFGANYGKLLMALTATMIPFAEIPPRSWQSGLGLRTKVKGETEREWKNYLKRMAEQRFPGVHITKSTSDALLIALYCTAHYAHTL